MLEFVNSRDLNALAALGTSCPDHFLRTKIRPLVLPFDPAAVNLEAVVSSLDERLAAYRADYAAYYERCKRPNSPAMRDPNAVIYLVPGVGMLSFARDKATARIAAEFYVNAINVIRGASSVSRYVGLAEQEAFDIEYWLLEEAKLQRMPKPKSLAGRVAFITGGAGGIGRAIAQRLVGEGACVVLADIDATSLEGTVAEFRKAFGRDAVAGALADVTDEAAVAAAFRDAVVAYGGVDIVVANAGIASAAPFEDTSLELWNRNIAILATGYFLAAREGYRIMKDQALGGSIVFVASKNALAASPGASAYCTAKAAEVHLARCLALEGAPLGIRANTVNPDAVLRGSKIWQGEWRAQRAASNKVAEIGPRRDVPSAVAAEALGLSGGHRRGGLLFRLRSLRQEHRQHSQRGRRQRGRASRGSRTVEADPGWTEPTPSLRAPRADCDRSTPKYRSFQSDGPAGLRQAIFGKRARISPVRREAACASPAKNDSRWRWKRPSKSA